MSVGYYRSWWRDELELGCGAESGIYVSPDEWTQPVPTGSPIDVVVMTCAASVAVEVNGVALAPGRVPVPRFGVVTFPKVLFARGNLTATAFDASGAVVNRLTLRSAGAAFALRAWVVNVYALRNGTVIAADGQDAALIGVELLDAQGLRVPQADVNVTFTITGPAVLVGVANGDPADHGPPKAAWRMTFHGLARAIVASSLPGAAGEITVTAAAAGFQPGVVRIVASAS